MEILGTQDIRQRQTNNEYNTIGVEPHYAQTNKNNVKQTLNKVRNGGDLC